MKKKQPKKTKPSTKTVLSETPPVEASRETVWSEAVGERKSGKCPVNHGQKPKIIAYTLGHAPTASRPGPAQREFMDNTSHRFAYRCLPLNIANQYGWELLSPCTFEATWDGGAKADSIHVEVLDDSWPAPVSHFGHGVLTFHINQVFRTPPGIQMMITGPLNSPKDGIYAMSGIIETDWSPYSFTMNWVITRPFFPIRFEKGEPIAHIMPVNLAAIEEYETQFLPIDSDPDLKEKFEFFQNSRNTFNEELRDPESEANKQKWQKAYFRGNNPNGCPVEGAAHWTKLDVKAFPGGKFKKK